MRFFCVGPTPVLLVETLQGYGETVCPVTVPARSTGRTVGAATSKRLLANPDIQRFVAWVKTKPIDLMERT